MAFHFIRPESRLLIYAARVKQGRAADSDRSAAALRRDYERWSRWAVGLLGFLLAVFGTFVAAGMIGTLVVARPPLFVFVASLMLITIATLIGAGGCVLLIALWRSGRGLVSAAAWWLRLPYAGSGRVRLAGGWILPRAVLFEPRIFARLVTCLFALLLAAGSVALFLRDLLGQITPFTAASAVIAVIALAAGVGQIGGVMRLVSGVAEADPLWVRIRSVFRR